MKLEKKMIVVSTLKAKKWSVYFSPKMNSEPASLKLRNAVTASLRPLKMLWPKPVLRISRAKASCSAVPVTTVLTGKLLRSTETSQAIPIITAMPTIPITGC